ncbi:hypothetical protein B0H19DRAFT_1072006 [Mycena capillaripes]|nr:hypothetical protein B0H19DRAFT_1072006 [Mycena capillaripes]
MNHSDDESDGCSTPATSPILIVEYAWPAFDCHHTNRAFPGYPRFPAPVSAQSRALGDDKIRAHGAHVRGDIRERHTGLVGRERRRREDCFSFYFEIWCAKKISCVTCLRYLNTLHTTANPRSQSLLPSDARIRPNFGFVNCRLVATLYHTWISFHPKRRAYSVRGGAPPWSTTLPVFHDVGYAFCARRVHSLPANTNLCRVNVVSEEGYWKAKRPKKKR